VDPVRRQSPGGTGTWASRAVAATRRRIAFAREYGSAWSWAASFYDAWLRNTRPSLLPGRGAEFAVHLRALPKRVHVRLGSTDWFVLEEVFLRRVYAAVRNAAPASAKTVLDLGANVGMTVLLWNRWWPSVRTVAVEPDEANLRLLRKNVAAAGIGARVELVRACVTGSARTAFLDKNHGEAAFRLSDTGRPTEAVAGRTVRDILNATGCDEIDLLKCDIEGSEREVFESCGAWIRQVRCLVVEVHCPYTAENLESAIRSQGGRFERVASVGPDIVVLRAR
jgi:FkbM family methyltransferase